VNFFEWLQSQTKPGIDYGILGLSIHIESDPRWPVGATTLRQIEAHLDATGAPSAIYDALRGAWLDWRISVSGIDCRLGPLATTAREDGRTVRVARDELGGWSARVLDASGGKCEALAAGTTAQEACDRLEAKLLAFRLPGA
jgi:hypothetical protein